MPNSRSRRAVLRSGVALGSLALAGCLDGSFDGGGGNSTTGNGTDGANGTSPNGSDSDADDGESGPSTVERWPMYQHDAQNTGSVDASPPTENVEKVWSADVGASISSSPVVDGETVYTLDAHGTAYAIEDGEILWSKPLGGDNTLASPATYGDSLLVPNADGVVALAREDGSQLWTYSTEGAPHDLTVSGDVVLFTDDEITLYAIEAQSGEERWTATSPAIGARILGTPAIVDGEAYVKVSPGLNREHGPIAKVNVESGYIRPAVQTEKPITTSLAAKDGMLFGGSEEGLHAFDIEGDTLWHYETDRPVEGTPSVAGETVYCFTTVGDSLGAAHAIDVKNGTANWVEAGKYLPDQRPLIIGDSLIYAGGKEKYLRSLDRGVGEQKWEVQGDLTVYKSMAYSMESYYTTSTDGRVRAYSEA